MLYTDYRHSVRASGLDQIVLNLAEGFPARPVAVGEVLAADLARSTAYGCRCDCTLRMVSQRAGVALLPGQVEQAQKLMRQLMWEFWVIQNSG